MTDKARELLERAADSLDGGLLYRLRLKEEIRDFLSTPEPEQEQEQLELIGELHPNGLVDFVNDEIPIHHVFPVKLYAKGEALINEIAKCNSDILLGKDHPAPRPEFVRLSEEEVNSLTYAPYEPYELICAVENRLVEKNKRKEIDTPEQKFDPEPVKEVLHTLLGTER